jgi:hypothetical protein
VVIPAYNSIDYLPSALRSVFNQSIKPIEVIVVDDGSTDGTDYLAQSFGVTVISLANGGPSAARNVGTRAASGEYVAYLDADDVWLPQKLAVQITSLESYGRPAFSFTDYRLFDEHGLHGRASELRNQWAFRKIAGVRDDANVLIEAGTRPVLFDSYILPSATLVRRADALAIGGFDETLRMAEDYEFFLRLFRIVPAVAVMKPLLLYRRHLGQATSQAASTKSGYFDVAARVAAAPNRYPPGDANHIANTQHLREYQLGIAQSRVGRFNDAIQTLERSLAARPTFRARLALGGSRVCRSNAGRVAFGLARDIWKRRPGKR